MSHCHRSLTLVKRRYNVMIKRQAGQLRVNCDHNRVRVVLETMGSRVHVML